jgi:hypothetical protein
LSEILTSYDLAADPPTTTLEINGRKTEVSLIPDLWVSLEQEKNGAYQYCSLWLECDTGSEHRGRWENLLRARIAFLKQDYEAYFQTADCVVGYVVIGPPAYRAARLRQLRAWTATLLALEGLTKWTSVFRFTAVDMDNIYAHPQLFAAPEWYTADDSPPSPLVDTTPPTKHPASLAEKEKRNGHTLQA